MDLAATRPRLPVLTSLRFFAALHVVLFHLQATKIAFVTGPLSGFAGIGYAGVSLFFVLSGFILVYTYAGRESKPGAFYRARFARVYPAYLFSLLLTLPWFYFGTFVIKAPLFSFAISHFGIACALVLLLVQSWVPQAALSWNSVAWSLSVEAFFYAVFPFLMGWFEKRTVRQLFVMVGACWITGLAISGTYVLVNPDHLAGINADLLNSFWLNAVKFNPLARLPEFLMGMACGMLFLRTQGKKSLATPLIAAAFIALAVIAYYSASIPYPILHTGLLGIFFAALIYGLALGPRWTKILDSRVMLLLGDASYSLYLLHAMILPMFFLREGGRVVHPTVPWILAAVGTAIVVSILVFRFIETPLRLKLNPKRAKLVKEELGVAVA